MNKILMSFLTITLVAVFAVGATRAYFSDTETSTGNSFTAGTLDLNLDGANINVVKFALSNKVPGDLGYGTWTVYNAGSINGYLDIQPITLVDDDNLCNEPEAAVPDGTCGAGQGELSANMNVDLFVDTNNNGVRDGAETSIYAGPLSGIATVGYDSNVILNSLATTYITMTWAIPTTVGNIIQSDSSTLGLTFELGQTTGQ